MTDDIRAPLEPLPKRFAGPFNPLITTLPVGSLATSVLLDVLSLIAENPVQRSAYEHRASEALALGLGGSIYSTALEFLDYLRAPAGGTGAPAASRRFALGGAMIAVYLLDVAARQPSAQARRGFGAALPTGLSLIGLGLLALARKRS